VPEFVKICPKCGEINPEYENLCRGCQLFIGMEPSVVRPAEAPEATGQGAGDGEQAGDAQRAAALPRCRVILAEAGLQLPVSDRALLGQAYPGSPAGMQLPADVPGVAYVHRQHCRFVLQDSQWYLEAVDQAPLGQSFTNPTWINGVELAAGGRRALADGDELRLSGVRLRVVIERADA